MTLYNSVCFGLHRNPHNKILDQFKMRAFADDKSYAEQITNVAMELENTLENRKMLVTSIFSSSHDLERPFSKGCQNLELFNTGLTHYQMTKFRLVNTETNCRHFKVHLKWKISTILG